MAVRIGGNKRNGVLIPVRRISRETIHVHAKRIIRKRRIGGGGYCEIVMGDYIYPLKEEKYNPIRRKGG